MKYLLAVSAGVDSMCLLHLFTLVAPSSFGVIHIHHHWREQSDQEALFLEQYCQKYHIPFYLYHWEHPKKSEGAARQFRYHCYEEVMNQNGYDILCTAHHLNDQVETMLQRLIRGSHIFNLTGIEDLRSFGNGYLWRPFLGVEKDALYRFTKDEGIDYFEDETNHSLDFQRNRLRHQVIPTLLCEDQQFLGHMEKWQIQLSQENDVLRILLNEKIEASLVVDVPQTFDLTQWKKEYQPCLTWVFLEAITQKTGLVFNDQWVRGFIEMIQRRDGEQQLKKGHLTFTRQYQYLTITTPQSSLQTSDEEIILTLNKPQKLDENHYVLLTDHLDDVYKDAFYLTTPDKEVILRHPKKGDQLTLSSGQHQKLTRLFINRKIPASLRSKQWVALRKENNEMIGVVNLSQSYLSKAEETGKMYYIIYYTLNDQETVDNG